MRFDNENNSRTISIILLFALPLKMFAHGKYVCEPCVTSAASSMRTKERSVNSIHETIEQWNVLNVGVN